MKLFSLLRVFSILLTLSGCANTFAPIASKQNEKSQSLIGVPSISVVLECGKCEVSPEIVKRIGESYMNAAGAAGVRVSATETATLRIESFSDRGAGRLLIAAVAGPLAMIFHVDRIKGKLIAGGVEFPIDETARFPFITIDSVAKDVGEIAFKQVASK